MSKDAVVQATVISPALSTFVYVGKYRYGSKEQDELELDADEELELDDRLELELLLEVDDELLLEAN